MSLNHKFIADSAKREHHLHSEIHHYYKLKDQNQKSYKAWKKACDDYLSYHSPFDRFWTDEFTEDIKRGNRNAIEDLLTYLEVSPFYFRSGYLKERLTHLIKQAPRTPKDDDRIRNIIWNQATGPNRREFKYFCRLAIQVNTPDFTRRILNAVQAHDHMAKGKFSYLAKYLTLPHS